MKKLFNFHISDLHFAKQKIVKDLTENKNRTLSALFRDLRKTDSVYGIGDWPIMSIIVQIASKYRNLTRKQIWFLCKQSKEYRDMKIGKTQFTKSLVESINY